MNATSRDGSVDAAGTNFDRREHVLFVALMIFLASQGLFLLKAPGLGLHLAVGSYTFYEGLPEASVFLPVNSNHPLVQHEWAFQVLTYGISALVGMDGLALANLLAILC